MINLNGSKTKDLRSLVHLNKLYFTSVAYRQPTKVF